MTPDSRPTEASDPPRIGLVGPFAKLGASCGTELPTGSGFACGRDNRIASLTIPMQQPPHGGLVRYRRPSPDAPITSSNATEIVIDGTHVFIESSCSMCRMMMFATTVIDLALIEDSDLAKAQASADLPSAPLLRTARQWEAATASWARM